MRIKIFILLLTYLILISSCQKEKNIRFDSEKWKTAKSVDIHPYREQMIKDISENELFLGFNYLRLVDSLGIPENVQPRDTNELYYLIYDDYGWDIDPIYTKYLVLILDKDSIVIDTKVKEWKKK